METDEPNPEVVEDVLMLDDNEQPIIETTPNFKESANSEVFIFNIHPDVTEKVLREVFAEGNSLLELHLSVCSLNIIYFIQFDPNTKKHRGFGYAQFKDEEDAKVIKEALYGMEFCGQPIYLELVPKAV